MIEGDHGWMPSLLLLAKRTAKNVLDALPSVTEGGHNHSGLTAHVQECMYNHKQSLPVFILPCK